MHPSRLKGTKMGTAIVVAAMVGFALLLVATVTLVIMNWSEKTLAPVLSILLVGTATTLAAVLVSLKPSSLESAFATSVVLDTSEGAPPLVIPSLGTNPKTASRLSELSRLGHPARNQDGKTVITIEKPTTEDQRFTFCGELLQYRIFQIIKALQRGGWAVGQGLGGAFASVSRPMRLSHVQDYPGKTFLDVVAANRFSNSDMERFHWEYGHLPLPRNTSTTLIHVPSSPATGPEKFIVRLHKPLFFNIDIVAEAMGATGPGVLPLGLVLQPEIAARCQTYQLQVTMQASFEWITAGNAQTQEYKDWADWLFSGLKEKLTD